MNNLPSFNKKEFEDLFQKMVVIPLDKINHDYNWSNSVNLDYYISAYMFSFYSAIRIIEYEEAKYNLIKSIFFQKIRIEKKFT